MLARSRIVNLAGFAFPAVLAPSRALAHASEGGLVLLLPTDMYLGAGVAVVALTVGLASVSPAASAARLFRGARLRRSPGRRPAPVLSWISFLVFALLVAAGFTGARDPLANPLPLYFWTVFWVGLVLAQGVFGDLWSMLNPWEGPYRLIARGGAAPLRSPRAFGCWPGCVLLLAFAGFALADPAPTDPDRLAFFAMIYWAATLAGMLAFGAGPWRRQAEFLTILMRWFALLAPFRLRPGGVRLGPPGWRIAAAAPPALSGAIFTLLILGTGSFDGLNETFYWFTFIGVNPLEHPGRSALIGETLAGLVAVNLLLIGAFALSIRLGLALNGPEAPGLSRAFRRLAPSVLPIGFAYHFAHYLTSAMVEGQYALAATSDPLGRGADLLGLGTFYVTTGFFNTTDTVRMIFLAQAGAVVAGHVLAVLLAHALGARLFGKGRRASLALAPLSIFMTGYTFLGLWLLAAPKGG
ncbi:hypothetical protein [Pikeienuella piscinae]|uniref:hypothetical protein n=1 Tax=Pikeienuella piscinae TaxID=2748098 RepID=UPI001FE5A8EF|nr:hypothetical protein [Pikeienuella piscinae]